MAGDASPSQLVQQIVSATQKCKTGGHHSPVDPGDLRLVLSLKFVRANLALLGYLTHYTSKPQSDRACAATVTNKFVIDQPSLRVSPTPQMSSPPDLSVTWTISQPQQMKSST